MLICQNLLFYLQNPFWATFIDIWRLFTGHTGLTQQKWAILSLLFFYFRLFYKPLKVNYCSIKVAED